jgi:hypothetical protein
LLQRLSAIAKPPPTATFISNKQPEPTRLGTDKTVDETSESTVADEEADDAEEALPPPTTKDEGAAESAEPMEAIV